MSALILLAHSLAWPNVARLAIACDQAGFAVEAIAPEVHPIHKMNAPQRTFVYRPSNARASLLRAIEISRPQLIIPCDDRVVAHLHRLHAEPERGGGSWISRLIETSLGSPKSFDIVRRRKRLGELSGLPQVDVPQTDAIQSLRQLKGWAQTHGLPAVLKLDGSTGGQDVIRIADPKAIRRAFFEMRLRKSILRALRSAISRREAEPVLAYLRGEAPGVSVQSFVVGRPANCAVACWRGEVLASIAVEAVRLKSDFGIATVVKVVEGRAMKAAAASVVRHLQLSGMCGFDFVIDDASERTALIEINPRATQINHLRCGPGLAVALRRAVEGTAAQPEESLGPVLEPATEVALFPHERRRDPERPHIKRAFRDLPVEEPELLKFYGYDPSSASGMAPPQLPNEARNGGHAGPKEMPSAG